MQLLKKYTLPVILIAMLATACTKEEGTDPNLPASNYMTATINGSYWTAADISRTSLGGDTVQLTGSRSNSKPVTIRLVINKYTGPGSYKVNDTAASALYSDNSGTYESNSGTITVSADNAEHMAASFQFTGLENVTSTTKVITNGQLNIKK